MPDSLHLDLHRRIAESTQVQALTARLACELGEQLTTEQVSEQAGGERLLEIVRRETQATLAIVLRGDRGRWAIEAAATNSPRADRKLPPSDLLGRALDEERPQRSGPWQATSLARGGPQVLALLDGRWDDSQLDPLAAAVELVWRLRGGPIRQRRRIARLEAILKVAAQWRQNLEMDDLLLRMAEAATQLLSAERASIFLWDRGTKTLVGRPALGVEGGELRIPDNAGVVGAVVQTGEPRRVDAVKTEQQEINRDVDEQLQFVTRNLLCVPLRAADGSMLGAFEMINKLEGDFSNEDQAALTEFAEHASLALENTQQFKQLVKSRNQMAEQAAASVRLIGQCPAIDALRRTSERVAATELALLILGENGTGKEVVSQLIHYHSPRRHHPLVAVNCAALTETLLESELFGHEKGAFTDAHQARAGKFELADGGTLFLDEIGDMSPSGQAKLLRVLEEKIVVRVGGSQPIHTDTRVIAATNQDLASMVRENRFREDLYFRLNVVTLELPPLRDRGDDVLLLAEHFLEDFCTQARRPTPRFSGAARQRLLRHSWPGNVRELRNLMERIAYLLTGNVIDANDLAFILDPGADDQSLLELGLSLSDATQGFQQEYILRNIKAARGNMTEAARRLGLHRSNLYRKMRQLDMETGEHAD